ncbi:MAG TPA: hypothetical protein VF999_01580, partial [Thermoanaerobaculia bacterium]
MMIPYWISPSRFGLALLLSFGLAPAARAQQVPEEGPGADLFVMPREALLREKPKGNARVVARLPGGARLKLVSAGEQFVQVEVAAPPEPGGAATG